MGKSSSPDRDREDSLHKSLSSIQKKYESVLEQHPLVEVLWSQYATEVEDHPAAPRSLHSSILQRAVVALPHCPLLWLAFLTSLVRASSSQPAASRSTQLAAACIPTTDIDMYTAVQDALSQAGSHPSALPLWHFVLHLLHTPSGKCTHKHRRTYPISMKHLT